MVCFSHHNTNKPIMTDHQLKMIITLRTPSYNLNKKHLQKALRFSVALAVQPTEYELSLAKTSYLEEPVGGAWT